MKSNQMPGNRKEFGEEVEKRGKRASFLNILCRLQRGILVFGGVMFVIWFAISYGFQNYSNSSDTVVAMKRNSRERYGGMEDYMEEMIKKGRLMDHVRPHHYNLTLQLFMPPEYNFTTKGKVNILIECLKKTKALVLHSRGLTVSEANVTAIEYNSENETSQSTSVIPLPEREFIVLYLDEALLKGQRYVLDLSFNGTINNQSIGLYRSGYQIKGANDMSWIASSQFQPSDARRVFPCFDEPGMKSTFQAHIIRRKGTTTLSNVPVRKTKKLDNYWEAVTFEVTPRMSTYLLAFVVGEVMPHAGNRNKGIQVWSRSDMIQYGEYAYNIAGDMLEFLGEYLEVPYTMPKTDLVAVPRFLHAAMENWGLVTFTEAALLYDPERSPTESKVFVTVVIAHELAHQWFGNLVTPTWWEHLWLNEGFASYYQYICVEALRPEWNIIHHFIGTTYEVMESDSLPTTRALSSPVAADDVLEYFDEIAYIKGGAIVHMVQHFIGERNFHKGLKNYLWKYSYKDVNEMDLWQNLNLWNENEIGVKQIMKTWTQQAGYPVVKIERNYSNKSAQLTQKVFLLEPQELELEEELSVTGYTGKDKR